MTQNISIDDYKNALGQFCSGVTVITSNHSGTPVGFTCQSFSSLSIDPPLIFISPQKRSTTWPKIRENASFVVNVLARSQREASSSFAMSGGNKFTNVDWLPSPDGLPMLQGSLAWIECELKSEVDAGDHTAVIAAVKRLRLGEEAPPLLFHRGRYVESVPLEANLV